MRSVGRGPTVIPLRWGAEGSLHSQQCLFSVAWVFLERRRVECERSWRRQLNLDQHGFGGRGVSGEDVRSRSVADQPSI